MPHLPPHPSFFPAFRAAPSSCPLVRLQLEHCPLGPQLWSFWLCGGHLWLPLTLVSPSIFLFVCFLFSSSPPCLLASLKPPLPRTSLIPSLPDHPVFPLAGSWGSPGEDLERNDGSQERPYFMSPELRDILLKGSAEEGKRAEVEE